MFEQRRRATAPEIARLRASFGHNVTGLRPDDEQLLSEAEITSVATIAELGALFTGLSVTDARPGAPIQRTVADCAAEWGAGGGTQHDQDAYHRGLAQAADPDYQPELLFTPSRRVSSGYLLVDAIHRAAALYTQRTATRTKQLDTIAYVLPRQFAC
jgi:hypothetical protein